ncbi:HAD hydrolase-like protein [Bradyrhizobium arachidis]|uniref:Haloacid dehalogenase n=1 Tax=Bradyrhizobium arachidis TaxID=858423 RepID=A0AAE7NMG6_9BRAD|nr:HAD hydrolase-like protein [Bradyrhizobium arachidis]QOZ66120.1 haloacid dehalogenase [Bradyrhizobium arachidis]SFV04567.1 2-haloacid dehalogenase/putative hydrolase of the HAD superfamily [Bradyrhizobium arachidis]
MLAFSEFKLLTFDCYGTLIDWDTSIAKLVQPWLLEMESQVPADLVVSTFALMQAKHQQTRPTLLYPDVLRRSWRDIEEQFGWDESPARADEFARSVPFWRPFADTVESLRFLSQHFALGILSNVDNASLAGTLRMLEVPFLFTVTAEDVSSYKPGQPHFDAAIQEAARRGIERSEMLHTAQSKHHDIAPGNRLGLTTVWVNRRHGKKGTGATLAATADPTLTVNSLAELVDLHKSAQGAS